MPTTCIRVNASLAAVHFLLMSYDMIVLHSGMSVKRSVINGLQLAGFIGSTAMVFRYIMIT
jgi:hypothetical protein